MHSLKLEEVRGRVRSFTVRETNHTEEEGWISKVRVSLEVSVEPKELGSLHPEEKKALVAFQKAGKALSEEDGAQTYKPTIKRKFGAHDFSVVASDGGTLSFLGGFPKLEPRIVGGEFTLFLSVDTDLPSVALEVLARMMDFEVKVSTLARQVNLFDERSAA